MPSAVPGSTDVSRSTAGSLRKAAAIVLGLHVLAGALLLLATGAQAAEVAGLCAVAYLAGIKHSYDWDHIAAIDNSSRRFAAAGPNDTGGRSAYADALAAARCTTRTPSDHNGLDDHYDAWRISWSR